MEKQRFRCRHCGRLKVQRVLGQMYCGERACQQARRNLWRRNKYAEDPDYRRNQQSSTAAWLSNQGGAAAYYRGYRSRQQSSAVSNKHGHLEAATGLATVPIRTKDEKERSDSSAPPACANRDALFDDSTFKSGRYMIVPSDCSSLANRDAFLVEIRVIPDG